MLNTQDFANTLERQLAGSTERLHMSRLLESLPRRIVAIDCETTGLVARYDYITEIALVCMDEGVDITIGDPLVLKPSVPLSAKINLESMLIQMGTEEQIDESALAKAILSRMSGSKAQEIHEAITEWAANVGATFCPNVAHNSAFDAAFIAERLGIRGKALPLSPVWVCTMNLARLVAGAPSASLDNLLRFYGMDGRAGAHSALQDALLCGQLYFKLRAELVKKIEESND